MFPFHPFWFYGLSATACILFFLYVQRSESLSANQNRWLIGISAALFLLAAPFADPFLNAWDERFHALIAWRMSHDHTLWPYLMPSGSTTAMLSNTWWTQCQLWLHKPPFFLWLMAGSFKLFGTHYWAARIPSYLMGVGMSLITLETLRSFSLSKWSKIMALGSTVFSFILFEWISGRASLDHNDMAVVFFISGALLFYIKSLNKPKYAILWGMFTAFAVLTKSLPGFLPLAFFLLHALLSKKVYKVHVYSTLISIFIPVIWWIVVANKDVALSQNSWKYVFKHLLEGVEGHTGRWDFYLHSMSEQNAWSYLYPGLLVIGSFLLILRAKDVLLKSFGITGLSVMLFYSLVSTKMPAYPLIAFLPMLIALAYSMDLVSNYIQKKWLELILIAFGIWGSAQFQLIVQTHDVKSNPWSIHQVTINQELANRIQPRGEKQIWLGMPENNHINAMFGNSEIIAVPDTALKPETAKIARSKGYTIHRW